MIFRKLHIQLTTLFTCVTGLVLIGMTIICLFISETDAKNNSYTTFKNNMNSIIDYLEGQSLISHQWIREVEQRYQLSLEILDNEKPLFFSELENFQEAPKSTEDFALAKKQAEQDFEISINPESSLETTQHIEFPMKNHANEDCYASVITIPRGNGALKITGLYSLNTLYQQFYHQRVLFAGAALLGILILALFSWLYTKRLLLPLEENQKRQTEFIAAASHELRSPLAVILSSLSALKIATPKEAPRFYDAIESEGHRMSRLIEDMLSLANADNHSWKIQMAPAELDTLLLKAYESYEPLAHKKHISLHISLPEDTLPVCLCDEARIMQVLAVLIDNAISYTPEGGCITLTLRQQKETIQLQVSDNGPGIPDSQKEAVFRRFYRADAAHQDREHFGLGLCIAREILRLHHGTITITDTPGGGATFQCTLPLAEHEHRN